MDGSELLDAVRPEVPFEEMTRRHGWLRRMVGVPQDAIHHAEGDVHAHTGLALAALTGDPAWRALPDDRRTILFTAVALHDVAKPDCTAEVDGRLTAHGHSRRGAITARRLLWEAGVPRVAREHIAALIRHHQVPLRATDRADLARDALRVSLTARNDDLVLLARADTRGRICADLDDVLAAIALYEEHCRALGVLDRPWPFASDHARFTYFRTPGRDPGYAAYDDTAGTVTVLSGLPGAGKDHWVTAHAGDRPVISLDALRRSMGVAPRGDQGPVIAAAREAARVHLRAGRDFVWNATNISRTQRDAVIGLAAAYRSRVEIVAVEAPAEIMRTRNRDRDAVVPEAAIGRMLARWEAPDLTEAHGLTVA